MTKLVISYEDKELEIYSETTVNQIKMLEILTTSIQHNTYAILETKFNEFIILPADVLQQSIIVIKD